MILLCILSTILLLIAFVWEFKNYIKNPRGEFEVMLHLAWDCMWFAVPTLTIWILYFTHA